VAGPVVAHAQELILFGMHQWMNNLLEFGHGLRVTKHKCGQSGSVYGAVRDRIRKQGATGATALPPGE
jgi:hypothetical protein